MQTQPMGFWIRAGARILDMIVGTVLGAGAGAVGGVVVFALASAGVIDPGWEARLGAFTWGSFFMGMVSGLAYDTISESVGGATLGKLICGLRVLREDETPVGVGGALIRNLAYYIDSFFFGMIAYSSMSRSPRQQRVGDKWGKTIVVRAASVPEASRRTPALGIICALFADGIITIVGSVLKAI
jgi:uncharacterized RDD family membrane protein YckC